MVERFTAPSAGRGSPVQLLPTGRESGEWVRHSDYAELEAEMERLRKKNEYLEDRNEECEHWRIHWKTKAFEALSRTGAVKVKALDEDDYEEIISAAAINMRKAASGIRGQVITVQDSIDWWVMKETERRILSALEPAASEGEQETTAMDKIEIAKAIYHATPRNKPFDKLSAFKRERILAEADAFLASLSAAGYQILSGSEVNAIRDGALEEAAEVGKEAAKAGDCHHVATAIRALGGGRYEADRTRRRIRR